MRISRTVRLALALAAVFSGASPPPPKPSSKSSPPPGLRLDRRGASGGDRVETFALAKGYQDPHFVDAKPSFVLQLSRADLLIVAGLELEIGYLPPLVDAEPQRQDPVGRRAAISTPRWAARSCSGRRGGDARHGRRPPVRQSALLDRSRERPRHRARDRGAAGRARPAGKAAYDREPRRLRGEARRQGEGVGRQDGSLRRRARSSPSTTPGPTSSSASSSTSSATSSPSPASRRTPSHTLEIINLIQQEKITRHPGRALLRHQDAEVHRATRPAPRWSRSTPRSAARRRSPTTSRSSTPTSTRWSRRSEAVSDHLRAAAAGLRRQPHPHRHPRLPRRARGGARGHLRRPLAGADRGARHAPSPTSLGYDLHSGTAYLFSLGFTFLGAAVFAFSRVHRRTRIPQEAVIGIVYAVSAAVGDPGDVEGDPGDRAPQGDAGRQHPVGDLARAGQDRAALRARRAPSTTSSASASC